MAKQIWKFDVPIGLKQVTRPLPPGAQIVHVAKQADGAITFWAEFNTLFQDEPHLFEERIFRVFGTGHRIESDWDYVGTILDEPYVWHLYEARL